MMPNETNKMPTNHSNASSVNWLAAYTKPPNPNTDKQADKPSILGRVMGIKGVFKLTATNNSAMNTKGVVSKNK